MHWKACTRYSTKTSEWIKINVFDILMFCINLMINLIRSRSQLNYVKSFSCFTLSCFEMLFLCLICFYFSFFLLFGGHKNRKRNRVLELVESSSREDRSRSLCTPKTVLIAFRDNYHLKCLYSILWKSRKFKWEI